ncbi:MAG: NADPH:quinone oxidoreductase family protein [Burkholderiales bacterium]|nr:NADPH:quinone oxidoreductase family protein [Burkholderiales bacterium]
MKAVLVREFGPPESIRVEEFAPPSVGDTQVAVEVHAAGVNYPDLLVMAGKYQILPPRPFIAGKECAGIVIAAGKSVTTCKPGDRVLAWMEYGAFAEQALAEQDNCFVIPQEMPFTEAACFGLVYQTAHFALVARANVKPGEIVLVTGATGGVGLAAVQLAKAFGATVVAAVSTKEKAAIAREQGADHVIDVSVPNLRDGLREQLRAVTGGRGADVVIEQVGGDVFDASLRALAWSARLVVVGFAGGRIAEVKTNYLLVKNIAVMGLQISDYRDQHPALMRRVMNELFELYRQGKVRPLVSVTYPLADFAAAFAAIVERKAIGKLALALKD